MNIGQKAKQHLSTLRNINREKIITFLKKYGIYLIGIGILIASIVFYFTYSQSRRVSKQLKQMDKYIEFVELKPIAKCKDYIKDFRLHDFYVASSARSYLSGHQKNDYSTPDVVRNILQMGARFLEFDIFNQGFNEDTIPVVSNGNEDGNWQYTLNTTTFEECCKIIAKYAFSERYLKNYSDPLFLSLNLKTAGNAHTVNQVADLIYHYLGQYLLGKEYSYSRKNIPREYLKDLIDKVVVFSDSACEGTKLEELVNYKWGDAFMKEMSFKEIKETHDHEFDTDYNRRSMTKIHPPKDARRSANENPHIPWTYGCQFVTMNYQTGDSHFDDYILKFRNKSFILKPAKLRYKKIYFKRPDAQDPNMSMDTMNVKTPLYNIDF